MRATNVSLLPSARRVVVGISDARVSSDPSQELVTHALGSCIALVLYDPAIQVMGMLHAMLPDPSTAPRRAPDCPAMFVETGVPLLIDACMQRGAHVSRMIVTAAGGAHFAPRGGAPDSFRVGQRNIAGLERALWRAGLRLSKCDLGGDVSRTLFGSVASGNVRIVSDSGPRSLRAVGEDR